MDRFAPLALALVLAALSARAEEPLEDGLIPGGVTCSMSGKAPTKPQPLSMCHVYNDLSCGVPAIDQENLEMFDFMMNIGSSCRTIGDIREHPTSILYCMNADPEQPQYIRPEPYVPEGIADGGEGDRVRWTQAEYQAYLADPTSTTSVTSRDQGDMSTQLLICDDWAITAYGTSDLAVAKTWCETNTIGWDCSLEAKKIPDFAAPLPTSERKTKEWDSIGGGYIRQSIFDGCGYMLSSPCRDGAGALIPDRDRFFCGDDIIMPSSNYDPLSVEAMLNDNDFGPPGLDDFGFRIVANRPCTDAELAALALLEPAQSQNMVPPSDAHAANEFSLYQPNCLRTAAQIKKYGFSQYADADLIAAWTAAGGGTDTWTGALVRDEKCFAPGMRSAAAGVLASAVLVLALAAAQML